ncbi:MAG: PTS transporter subunit EIIC, partial [Clostridiales bacterium]|nr:PTS transporter subunit EIIC [Clostridiales bacterium]
MAIDKSKLARDILESLGGRENIASVVHCATRLRFTLKDPKHADVAKCRGVYGVIAVVEKGGQHQVIIGNTVPEVYKEVVRIGALDTASGSGKQVKTGNIFSRGVNGLISTIAGIFPPILYPLIGCGLLMGILVVIKSIVGFKLGVDGNPILDADGKPIFILDESDTFKILHAISTTVFFFLPVLIGFSAGKRFGANPYITATIALALVHPDINSLAGGEINFFGIPNFGVLNFGSSVLPILFSSYLAAKIEIYLTAKLPSSIKNFIIPLTCFVIVVPLTIGIIGPITIWFANTLADGYKALPDWLPGILVGTFWQVLVVFGIHWAIVPMGWNNIATNGFDTLDPLTHVAALSQTGACFGIWLKMKNKEDRNLARQGWITGLFGITEPIIYGVTLKRKKQFLMGMIGGFCGGLIAGLIGAKSYRQGAYGFGALLSTLSNDGFEAQAFFGLLVGLLTSFSVAAVLSFITYKDDTMQNSTLGNMVESVSQSISNTASKIVTFLSPLKGVVK